MRAIRADVCVVQIFESICEKVEFETGSVLYTYKLHMFVSTTNPSSGDCATYFNDGGAYFMIDTGRGVTVTDAESFMRNASACSELLLYKLTNSVTVNKEPAAIKAELQAKAKDKFDMSLWVQKARNPVIHTVDDDKDVENRVWLGRSDSGRLEMSIDDQKILADPKGELNDTTMDSLMS